MIGVELESWSPEAKDGRYDGFRYFTAPEGRGVFIRRRDIMDVIPLEHDPEIPSILSKARGAGGRDHPDDKADRDGDDYEDAQYEVGDRVEIQGEQKGLIRYIGKDSKNYVESLVGAF